MPIISIIALDGFFYKEISYEVNPSTYSFTPSTVSKAIDDLLQQIGYTGRNLVTCSIYRIESVSETK